MPDDNWSIIYSGNSVQADLLKSILEASGIQAVLEDEFLGRMFPYAGAFRLSLFLHRALCFSMPLKIPNQPCASVWNHWLNTTGSNWPTRIMEKLDVHETASLVLYAIRRGMVSTLTTA